MGLRYPRKVWKLHELSSPAGRKHCECLRNKPRILSSPTLASTTTVKNHIIELSHLTSFSFTDLRSRTGFILVIGIIIAQETQNGVLREFRVNDCWWQTWRVYSTAHSPSTLACPPFNNCAKCNSIVQRGNAQTLNPKTEIGWHEGSDFLAWLFRAR
jgi:hypothetical protein